MNKYENYFKSQKHDIKKDLINTYIKYNDKYLISNGYGIVMVNNIPDDFSENIKYNYTITSMFDNWYIKAEACNSTEYYKIDIDTVKNNVKTDTYGYKVINMESVADFRESKNYSIDYGLLKKLIALIGYKELCIMVVYSAGTNDYLPVIKLIGKDNQVGYMLPMGRF